MGAAPHVARAPTARPRCGRWFPGCIAGSLAFALVIAAPVGATITSIPGSKLRAVAAGGIGLRLVDVPEIARNDPRARVYIVDHLAPGSVIHRRIEVSNTTASTVHVALYAAAATIANGSFLGAAGHARNDLSTWTSVSPEASDVQARSHVAATVTVAVPPDASPGEQYGVVWAEARSTPVAGIGITQVSRIGIRLYLSIGPGGPPAPDFTIDSLTAERALDGRPLVVASVHNTGGRALDMSGTLRLSGGPGRLSAGPFPAALGVTLAIGDTEPVSIALDKRLPAGPWAARITLDSGLIERSASATITFPDIGSSRSVQTAASRHGWSYAVITSLLVLLVLLVLLSAIAARFGGRRRRRQRRSPRASSAVAFPIALQVTRRRVEGGRESAEPLRSSPTPQGR